MRICGSTVKKPSCDIGDGVPASDVEILPSEDTRYVSRGGLKLEAALDSFGIDVSGMRAIDIGASTGGFTECLLAHGCGFGSRAALTGACRRSARALA